MKTKLEKNVYHTQVEEIQKHRWIESEKVGHDVGVEWAAQDWAEKHAASFREHWFEN